MLKDYLQEAPILRYPDPTADYILYTDASKYAYAGVLTQSIDGTDHPVAYTSGLFRGSQLNWAALTKEAYAIYMSVKKLSFYLDSAQITLRSDHLLLKKFLEKNMMDAKVNNWAVELESQNINFEFITGTKNVLADTLNRLIEFDESIKLPEEEPGYEFGYTPFEELPLARVTVIEEVIISENQGDQLPGSLKIQHNDPIAKDIEIKLPLTNSRMKELQEQDPLVGQLRKQWSEKKLDRKHFTMEDEILKKKTVINGILYTPTVVPDVLKDCLLILAHDKQGHNGFKRTYRSLKQLYHWKGMKKTIQRHCNACSTYAKHNIKVQQIQKEHFKVPPQPREFIAMDLIGEFHPSSSKGNRYALMAVCMLTGFSFCIPIKSKKAEDVMKAYTDNICCVFRPLKEILTENGTEFKNKLWTDVFKRMCTEHRTSPIYSPQCNGRIEGFHKFLKATIGKQLQKGFEWDDIIPKATSAYNFFLTQSSKEAPFFLMFGRQAAVKHMLLDSESPKYLGNKEGLLNIELMRKLYHIIAYNLAKSRAAQDGNKYAKEHYHPRPKVLEPGKNILVRDHDSKVFKPKYLDYCVVKMAGKKPSNCKRQSQS